MHKPSFAQLLLALATSIDRAREIEGDLIEQSKDRRTFTWSVLFTTGALLRRSLLRDALPIGLLAYAVYELAIKLNWWFIRPVRFSLGHEWLLSAPQTMMITFAIWALLAVGIGSALVRGLPAWGFKVAVLAVGLIVTRLIVLDSPFGVAQVLVFGALPLLAACWFAHQRNVMREIATSH
jgi:hypothetical protein